MRILFSACGSGTNQIFGGENIVMKMSDTGDFRQKINWTSIAFVFCVNVASLHVTLGLLALDRKLIKLNVFKILLNFLPVEQE